MRTLGMICLIVMAIAVIVCAVVTIYIGFMVETADKAPTVAAVPRTPVGHLMMVLTDGQAFYVADGAGVNVYDPNVVHRLMVSEPNSVAVPNDPNGAE